MMKLIYADMDGSYNSLLFFNYLLMSSIYRKMQTEDVKTQYGLIKFPPHVCK